MAESLQCSHNLPRHSRMWQASILVRALVHGWRHMGGAHMRVDGVAVALVSGLDSCDSPSALSVPRAHSSGRAALESPLRCSELRALWTPAMAAADHQTLGFSNEHGHAVAKTKELMACGHHSRSL